MAGQQAPDVQEVGAQVEALLAEFAGADPAAAERAEELVRLLVEFYGAGLARVVDLLGEQGVARLLDDPLVSGLLVLHDLHPQSTDDRVRAALDLVRPYLGSHAGDVEYLGLDDRGVVHLKLTGSCDGCPSSLVTVQTAIERSIADLAPEVTGVEVAGVVAEQPAPVSADGHPLLPLHPVPAGSDAAGSGAGTGAGSPGSTWVSVDGLADLAMGALVAARAGDVGAVVGNVGGTLYAYQDRCPGCAGGLSGGALDGVLLSCPGCTRRYDVVHAGRQFGVVGRGDALHLAPLPLLTDGGGVRIAVPAQAAS